MTELSERTYFVRNMLSGRSKEDNLSRCSDDLAQNSFQRVTKYQTGQIVALTLAFVFSTAACLTLSYVNFVLTPDCLLFATWTSGEAGPFREMEHPRSTVRSSATPASMNNSIDAPPLVDSSSRGWLYGQYDRAKLALDLNGVDTKWGRKRHCYVTQYGFAAAAVAAFILCWFFVFFRPTREAYFLKKKTAASKLVVPAIVFCTAFVLCAFVATVTLQIGIASWCESVSSILSGCSAIRNYAVTWAGKTTFIDFFPVLVSGQVLAWIASVAWLGNLITLSKRLYYHVDFPEYFFRPYSSSTNNAIQSETDSE